MTFDTSTRVTDTNPYPVTTRDPYLTLTPALGTVAYGSGSVLFAATELTGVSLDAGDSVVLQSVVVVDKGDQGLAFDLHFFDRTVTFGTVFGVLAISDADVLFSMGWVNVGTADYKDLGGARVATVKNIGLPMKPNATSLFVAGVTGGTPTYGSADLKFNFGFLD